MDNITINVTEVVEEFEVKVSSAQGLSAYEVAIKNGFVGTEAEWLESLKGEQGEQGAGYNATSSTSLPIGVGLKTITINEPAHAFLVGMKVKLQNTSTKYMTGTITNFLGAMLVITVTGYSGSGTYASWSLALDSVKGDTGKSAYELAVDNGFVGTEPEWLLSLKGEQGEPGMSNHTNLPIFTGNLPTIWTDLDLSSIVGARQIMVILRVYHSYNGTTNTSVSIRTKGDSFESKTGISAGSIAGPLYSFINLLVPTNESGIIQIKSTASLPGGVQLMAYW